jgi:NADPH-dependent 2,4-dienoyl-CoA reductase/sulfur reductase-like enzyme/nitrite reductase/ring-hydroxylating ferredoxin subunit
MADIEWRKVSSDSALVEGVPVVVEIGEEKILLARVKGTVYAVGHECPHYQEKLEKGVLFGTEIVCKSHFARMDVTTGRVVSPPAMNDLPVYPVKVQDGEVWVGPAGKPKFPKPQAPLGSDPRVFLIIGAGAAGNAAAETLRRQGFAGRIVMVTEEQERPYDRPNLSKDFITGKAGEEWLPLRGPKFYPAQGIELLTGRTVQSLDTGRKTVRFADGESLGFDRALIATGGRARTLSVPGGDSCLLLRTAADARALLEIAKSSRSVLIIGAGFIGLELAGSLRERGLAVTVTAPEAIPLASVLGDRIGAGLMALHQGNGVSFLMGRKPVKIEGPSGARITTLDDGTRVESDFVIAGLGVQPAIDFLAGTSLAEAGAVTVDADQRTSARDIFAAGDIAAVPGADGTARRVEHWVAAERQGQRAAIAMLDRDPGVAEVDVFWTKQAGASLKYVGNARGWDQVVYRGSVEDGEYIAGFFRGGVLLAGASIGMARDIVAVERILRLGGTLSAAELADPSFDIIAAAGAVGRSR